MKLIVGLGNPGREYAATRHNAGFLVIDCLAHELGLSVGKKLLRSLTGQGQINGEKVVLAKPQTYMNLSGESVGALLRWYKLTTSDLIVIYDDLDLPPGKLRIRGGGGSGGHKGMQSVIEALGTEDFTRVRIGIGRPRAPEFDPVDYVLSGFSEEEAGEMKEVLAQAVEAVLCIVRDGVERAMNLYNRR